MMDYDQLLNDKIKNIKPSGIRKFFDILDTMEDVISLGVGQPDFMTPWHIRKAGIEALQEGKTYYTANAGLPELRREVSKYLSRRFGMEYDPAKETVITVGGSEAIDIALRVLVSQGDEVLVPEPSFVCYSPLTELCGGVAVAIPTYAENDFKLTAEAVKNAITPKTKALILPFPNNPTGAIMKRPELEELAAVLKDKNIVVISDEIYAELTYNGDHHVSISTIEGMREKTVVVSGFSKCYAMTGWRLGYACGPAPIISAMNKTHQFAIMCAPTTSQYAAIEALKNGDGDIAYMVGEYDKRRRLVLSQLREAGFECHEPKGAFYFFPSIKKFGMSSERFCEQLLLKQKVAVIPGNAFGEAGEGFVRMSYAYSTKNLLTALSRIKAFVDAL